MRLHAGLAAALNKDDMLLCVASEAVDELLVHMLECSMKK